MIKEVSAAKFGEVVFSGRLPKDRKITVTQPLGAAWLVSVPKARSIKVRDYQAIADATVRQGLHAGENAGRSPALQVWGPLPWPRHQLATCPSPTRQGTPR